MVEAGGAAAVKIDDVASLNTAVASPRVCRSAVHVAPSQRNSTSADPYTKTGAGPLVIRFLPASKTIAYPRSNRYPLEFEGRLGRPCGLLLCLRKPGSSVSDIVHDERAV